MEKWRVNFDRLPLKESAEICQSLCKGVTVQDISKWKKPEHYGSEPIKALKTLFYKPRVRRQRNGHRIEATLSEVEISRLQIILEDTGETKTEFVKRLINEEYERTQEWKRILDRRITTK